MHTTHKHRTSPRHVFLTMTLAAIVATTVLSLLSCNGDSDKRTILFDTGRYPYAVLHDGKYYFIKQAANANNITITATDKLTRIADGVSKTVWPTDTTFKKGNIWSPELHFIDGKWYIYFEADDGNTDNHQIYVLENPAPIPTQGTFTMKGVLRTNKDWNFGIHPTTFVHNGRQYLLWSGWPKRRSDTETQCIYIAAMSNPWTVGSHRVMISQPTYEWERQWINIDGTRSAYPIYVNENPTMIKSSDGKRIVVFYSASGCWTTYQCVGMVWADADANLLDRHSWHKHREPVLKSSPTDSVFGPSDIDIVASGDKDHPYMLYETMKRMGDGSFIKQIKLKKICYDSDGMPVLGKP